MERVLAGLAAAVAAIVLGCADVRAQPAPAAQPGSSAPRPEPSGVAGYWLGTLRAGAVSLRVQVNVTTDAAGHPACTLDSLDQGAFGLGCANVVYSSPDFSFDVPVVGGRYVGKVSADGKAVSGTWTQGQALALDLARQDKPEPPPAQPAVAFDSAIAPVSAAEMQAVLDRDLEQALKSGQLAPQTGSGVTIGVVRNGVRRVLAYGAAKPDSIFEIGSVTKTFTGLLLAQLIEQGKVNLDAPVRELLPAGTVAKPDGREITLFDLVTQHSGLPRMPDNFHPADPNNPYADYRPADLYAFIAKHGVERPASTTFLYSNLGVGLLGQALANRAGKSYAELLKEQITAPLGMKDTIVTLTPEQQARFIPGHTANHQPAHVWDIDALAGAGAIRSTADDMLTYLEANLHPEQHASKLPAGPKAMARAHEIRDVGPPGMHIAFAWLNVDANGSYWHNGATGGYSSFVFFDPKQDYAAVVLVNMTIDAKGGSFADRLGLHIGQRFAGLPALSLAN